MKYQVFIYFPERKQPVLEFQTDNWRNVVITVLDYKEIGYKGFVRNKETTATTDFKEIV